MDLNEWVTEVVVLSLCDLIKKNPKIDHSTPDFIRFLSSILVLTCFGDPQISNIHVLSYNRTKTKGSERFFLTLRGHNWPSIVTSVGCFIHKCDWQKMNEDSSKAKIWVARLQTIRKSKLKKHESLTRQAF